MATQRVLFNLQDGGLGALPPPGRDLMAVVGCSSTGTTNALVRRTRDKDVMSEYGVGPLVEASVYGLKYFGLEVAVQRAAGGVAGDNGALTDNDLGTSDITEDAAVVPRMDCDVVLYFPVGGTRGTAGITYRYSLDAGKSWHPSATGQIALGTATSITLPEVNTKVDLAAGTILAGRQVSWRTSAPAPTAAELDDALEVIEENETYYPLVHITSPVDATSYAGIVARAATMEAKGKPTRFIFNARRENAGETPAQYKTALDAIFTSRDRRASICAGWQKTVSGVSQRNYKLPRSYAYAPLVQSVDLHIDVSQKTAAFQQRGVSLRDANGQRDDLDESIDPGFDDARYVTAETRDDRRGSYIVNPNLFAPDGSDYEFMQHGRVMDRYCRLIRFLLVDRLSREVFVGANGRILESEAFDIDSVINASADAILGGKVSSSTFVLSRTDNVLATKILTGSGTIVPLAYPKGFTIDLAFSNPAMRLVQVAA